MNNARFLRPRPTNALGTVRERYATTLRRHHHWWRPYACRTAAYLARARSNGAGKTTVHFKLAAASALRPLQQDAGYVAGNALDVPVSELEKMLGQEQCHAEGS
jgi:hypothetical protein